MGKDYAGQDCSIARALELVGERWTLLIVRDALNGVRRYNDFLVHLDIPKAVLAERLAALTDAGVLRKRQYQQSPPREEYVLTAMGRDLFPIVYGLAQWGERHLPSGRGPRRVYRHVSCGKRLDITATCTGCGKRVPPGEVEVRPGPGEDGRHDDRVSVALREPHRLLEPLDLS